MLDGASALRDCGPRLAHLSLALHLAASRDCGRKMAHLSLALRRQFAFPFQDLPMEHRIAKEHMVERLYGKCIPITDWAITDSIQTSNCLSSVSISFLKSPGLISCLSIRSLHPLASCLMSVLSLLRSSPSLSIRSFCSSALARIAI